MAHAPRRAANPAATWNEFFKTHQESSGGLLETITYLGRGRKFDQVEAALVGFLRNHPKEAEPWMYNALALALDVNKRGAEQVRTALGYAGYLARQSHQADQLLMVAALLYRRDLLDDFEVNVGAKKERVGVGLLLDQAAEEAPHLPEPALMAMTLAQKVKDPKRMADAVERLLALGWPELDDALRLQARQSAEALAKTLRAEDRDAEAEALLSRLAESEGRDLWVRLSWTGDADLDLNVREPLGATAGHGLRRTVFGGAIIKEGLGRLTEEVYVCPRAFDGDYTITVQVVYTDEKQPVTEAKLEVITHEGLPSERKQTSTISLARPRPVVVHLTGGRRRSVLPFVAPVPQPELAAQPGKPGSKPAVASGPAPVTGTGPKPASAATAGPPARVADALRPVGDTPAGTTPARRPAPKPIDPGAGRPPSRTKPRPITVPGRPAPRGGPSSDRSVQP